MVIGIILAAIVFLWTGKQRHYSSQDRLMASGVFGLVGSCVVGLLAPTVEVTETPVNLVALRSADGLSGTFVLGTGGLYSTASYDFMMLLSDGTMSPGRVYAHNRVFFAEDRSFKNTGVWTRTVQKTETDSGICLLAFCSKGGVKVVRDDFRLPPGSVVKRFSVD